MIGYADVVRRYDRATDTWESLPVLDTSWSPFGGSSGMTFYSSLRLALDTSTSPPRAFLATMSRTYGNMVAVAELRPSASSWTWLLR